MWDIENLRQRECEKKWKTEKVRHRKCETMKMWDRENLPYALNPTPLYLDSFKTLWEIIQDSQIAGHITQKNY